MIAVGVDSGGTPYGVLRHALSVVTTRCRLSGSRIVVDCALKSSCS
jgi:hypothetical protein